MKKILLGLIIVAYAITSFIFIKYFEINEIMKVISSDKESINVVKWDKNEGPEKKLSKIRGISKEENVNIYKVAYKPIKTAQKQKIVIYAAIADENQFYKQISLKWGRGFTKGESNEHYLSSLNEKDSNQIGGIELFSPNNMLEIRPMEAAKSENLRGTYVIDSKNPEVVEKVKERLHTNVGFQIENQKSLSTLTSLTDQKIYQYLVLVLIIVLILISLSFLYYILLNFKELAVRKLFGYTDAELIFKILAKENLRLHVYALGIIFICQGIYLFFYNHMNKLVEFGMEWLVLQLAFTCLSILVGFIPFLMVFHIKIADMLKNKKPIMMVQFLNYSSKGIFSLLLLIMLINIFHQYQEISSQKSNEEKWMTTKHYAFYEYQANNVDEDRDIWAYHVGIKSKELFHLNTDKGALLIKPSDGIAYKGFIKSEARGDMEKVKDYDPQVGNTLHVNANYLTKNPVYDYNGNKIDIKDDYGDYLLVLVPNKYRNEETEILKAYKEWYQFKRFVDEDMYNQKIGKAIEPHKEVEVKLIFIKDEQKHFLYNPDIEKENQNYSKDSTLIVINSENIGGDSYLNYLTSCYFFPYITNSNNPYKELEGDISLVGLKDVIMTAPSLYSVVDGYIFKLQNNLNINLFLAVVLLIMEMVVTVFTILNYVERNKIIHSVKKMNGFSFIRRHSNFILLLIFLWLGICCSLFIFKLLSLQMLIFLLPSCLVVELVMVYFVVKFAENKKMKDTLKGA